MKSIPFLLSRRARGLWRPVELDVPAMIHVSGSCNPRLHATATFYIAADLLRHLGDCAKAG